MTSTPNGYRCAHSASALTARFGPEAFELTVGDHRLGWSLSGLGIGEEIQPVGAGVTTATANRMEYARRGVVEWYVNGPLGLQHGFNVPHRPDPAAAGALVLELALRGSLAAQVDHDGRGLAFTPPDGPVAVRYTGLTAFDAAGRTLPARFRLVAGRLQICVQDANARYPVVVDPLFETATLSSTTGSSSAGFGDAVAISGDTIVVGAPGTSSPTGGPQGLVYVFEKPPYGWATMTETATLRAPAPLLFGSFGAAVDIAGDTIVVGDPLRGAPLMDGAVFVFEKPPGGWVDATATVQLTPSAITTGQQFGTSVATDGTIIAVGAPDKTLGTTTPGAVFVFERPPLGWVSATETATLTASDGTVGMGLGASVALDQRWIVAGAPDADDGRDERVGAAYVFEAFERGWRTSTEVAKLSASNGMPGDRFGLAASMDGDIVVTGGGQAYVFAARLRGWATRTETAILRASDAGAAEGFGESVAIAGGAVLVGASAVDVGSVQDQGAVYVFSRLDRGWRTATETLKVTAAAGSPFSRFGAAVAIDGRSVVVGARNASVPGRIGLGAAHVFVR
ncbi:MAG: hypothetical protein AAF628_15490 [Planctomycetota bacterium]